MRRLFLGACLLLLTIGAFTADAQIPIIRPGRGQWNQINPGNITPPSTGGPYTVGPYNVNRGVNVQAYGAICGAADSTTAIQNAVNAAPPSGTVLFPACPCGSPYTISAPIHNLANTFVTFRGQGWSTIQNAVFGNAGWLTLTNHCGSVIYQTTAATDGFDILTAGVQAGYYNIYDLMVLGAGSGTSAGIALGNASGNPGIVGSHFQNVMVANFSSGWLINGVEDSTFISARTRGDTVGFDGSPGHNENQNTFYNLEMNTDTTCAIFSGGDENNISGGLCQNATVNGIVLENGTNNSSIMGVHFENSGMLAGGSSIVLEGPGTVARNIIMGNRISGSAAQLADIYITGASTLINTIANNTASHILQDTARFNTFWGNQVTTFDDFTHNSTVWDGNGQMNGADWLPGQTQPTVAGAALQFLGGLFSQNNLAVPANVKVTPTGGASTTYCYRVSALDSLGETTTAFETCDAAGPTTLSGTTYETVTWNNSPGAKSYKIYGRTSEAELFMATCPGGPGCSTTAVRSWQDTGIITPGQVRPRPLRHRLHRLQ